MARAIIKAPGSYGALHASLEIPMPEAEPAPPPSAPAPGVEPVTPLPEPTPAPPAKAEAKPRRATRAGDGARAEAGAAREITASRLEAPAATPRKRVARANEYGIRVPYPAPGSNPAFDEVARVYGEAYPLDEDFLAALAQMPDASGIALGFDRLAMLAAGVEDIALTRWLGNWPYG